MIPRNADPIFLQDQTEFGFLKDATGANRDPRRDPVWSKAEMIGLFVDAIERGELADSEIIGYQDCADGQFVGAFIRSKRNNETALWRMNLDTLTPVRICRAIPNRA